MARKIMFQQAINEALDHEMARDPTVIVMGEDIVGGTGTDGEMDAWGGVLGVTKGLHGKYGNRIMDTPISESAFVGAAVGAAVGTRCGCGGGCGGLRHATRLRINVHRFPRRVFRPNL